MRKIIAALVPLAFLSGLLLGADEKGPETIVFETKNGNVTYQHKKHSDREKGGCKTCHDKLWPQKKGAPLNYKTGVHKVAEAKELSCGACHRPKGVAFESKGNCVKCHVKKTAPAKAGG